MKRFLAKVALLLGAVLVLTCVINTAYISLNRYPVDNTGKFAEVPTSIQVANLGSSHGLYGFNYEKLEDEGISCFNFALSAQSLEYDYRILEEFGDRIAPGGTVFVCVSYFALYGKSEIYRESFESWNRRYYRFLPDDLIREYDPEVDFWTATAPALDAGLEELWKVFNGYYASYDRQLERAWSRKADDIDLAKDVDAAYTRHLVTDKQNDDGSMMVNEEGFAALYKIIELVRSRGAEPVLVTTPLTREYNDAAEKNVPGFADDFYGRIGAVVSETGVRYFDYSHDTRFVNNHRLFMNADHLNKQGAALFTATLIREAHILD